MKKSSQTLFQVLEILQDGQFHDGNDIGQQLHVTRSAVWKVIQKLLTYNIKIKSIKNKGYALLEPINLLDQLYIQKHLSSHALSLDVFESLPSTQTYLKSLSNKSSPYICIAEEQTEGKGRFNRTWYSPFGKNIYLSCLYTFQKDISELAGLSLVTSLAIVSTLNSFYIEGPFKVKWPNDVIYHGKKIAGSLIEVQAETNGFSKAIIGIGININMLPTQDPQASSSWTSLREILDQYIDRNSVYISFLPNLISYLKKFEQEGLSAFIEEWNTVDILKNQKVQVKDLVYERQGTAKGINMLGHLLLEQEDGSLKICSSGDTTLIKPSA
jgi:BirA family biotin operon repressor/biotin-[acetyl-CoA-carboxylase] ligase